MLLVLLAAGPAVAEVPPLSDAALVAQAQLIVRGTVKSMTFTDSSPRDGFVDRSYAITVGIEVTEQGRAHNDATVLVAHGWQAMKRPRAFAGPSGHYTTRGHRHLSQITEGSTVRLFLRRQQDGTYTILFPNGFEILSPPQ